MVANPTEVLPRMGNEQRIDTVVAWMKQNLRAPASGPVLAGISGLSQAAFFANFKKFTGSSPKDYLLRLRVEAAAGQLRGHPEDTVTKVAHAFGFSSSQYFATVFRRYFGKTPAEYRAR
jgi:transcriptional regulator GlxA family with amidase domain